MGAQVGAQANVQLSPILLADCWAGCFQSLGCMGASCACGQGPTDEEQLLVASHLVPHHLGTEHVPAAYDYTRSTEDCHSVEHFTGIHRDIRPLLDYTYNRKYSAGRV